LLDTTVRQIDFREADQVFGFASRESNHG
jgi:hypothetical protein